MKGLLQELPHAVWHLDHGFLYNLKELFRRPGYAIKDYLDGKRKPFYHPLSFMLIILGTMYVLMQLMQVHYYDPLQDAGMTESQAAFWKEYDATQQTWTHLYKWYIPFYLPFMSFIYWAWLRVMKMKYTYAESIVITFFSSSQMTIPQIFVLVLDWWFNSPAFNRTSDQLINWPVITAIYFFQYYQLGNPGIKKPLRIILSAIGAALMLAFAFTAVFTFLWLANTIGL